MADDDDVKLSKYETYMFWEPLHTLKPFKNILEKVENATWLKNRRLLMMWVSIGKLCYLTQETTNLYIFSHKLIFKFNAEDESLNYIHHMGNKKRKQRKETKQKLWSCLYTSCTVRFAGMSNFWFGLLRLELFWRKFTLWTVREARIFYNVINWSFPDCTLFNFKVCKVTFVPYFRWQCSSPPSLHRWIVWLWRSVF